MTEQERRETAMSLRHFAYEKLKLVYHPETDTITYETVMYYPKMEDLKISRRKK